MLVLGHAYVTSGKMGWTSDYLHQLHAIELLRYGGCVPPPGPVELNVHSELNVHFEHSEHSDQE